MGMFRAKTTLLFLAFLLLGSMAFAQMGETISVTVTNDSPQPISPPILIAHTLEFQPVVPGDAASPELWLLAEDGSASELANMARGANGVHEVVVAAGPLGPGASVTLEIGVTDDAPYLSVLGMLVVTNDAFVFWGSEWQAAISADAMGDSMSMGMTPAIYDGVPRVFDAGTEADTELCEHIPGPPCGNPGVRVTDNAEGAVHLDGGVLGVGDLDPAELDWRNPAITVLVSAGM